MDENLGGPGVQIKTSHLNTLQNTRFLPFIDT